MRQRPKKSRRGSTAVFGVLLIVLITFVSGILFYTFVMQNINFATNTFSNQMSALLVNSFSINSTHIIAFLQNSGSKLVEITSAYVNGLITAIVNLVKIAPNAVEAVILAGNFIAGNVYSIKLGTIFGTDVNFQASF
jgi:hypothetical protein